MFLCVIGFLLTPIFGLSIRVINNITDVASDRFLPLQTCYPIESSRSPYFELIYATQLVAGSFVRFSFSVPDNFFGALVFHASAQCEILGERMKELLDGQVDGKRLFRRRLGRLVDTHVHLLRYSIPVCFVCVDRFVDAVEESFNLVILAQVLCLSLIICCLGFGVIQSIASDDNENPPIVQAATLAGTLLNLMIHMLVYCIASEILAEHASLRLYCA
ncbi:hypothetical protein TSAR_002719 [Trichomalopsis sarcophagae]|uniref:Odorant receptor n=1 Tax=Trichomalopsis sarcophagae TaxID=543379 RepID=A0A232F322_9HYME|nr:hypothetical protein TSAR_002719 [Trichomalopsis sarcophagae]